MKSVFQTSAYVYLIIDMHVLVLLEKTQPAWHINRVAVLPSESSVQ